MNRSALLLILPLLAGCDVHSQNPSQSGDNVSIQADSNGAVAFDLPFAKGSIKLPQSMMNNGNIDIDGVKLMPGSSVRDFNMHGGDHGAEVYMRFAAPAPPDQVRSYFLDQFRKRGVEAALAGDSVSGKSKDGSAFTIEVRPAGSGSDGRIVIHDEH